jgi:hypothetical protein
MPVSPVTLECLVGSADSLYFYYLVFEDGLYV